MPKAVSKATSGGLARRQNLHSQRDAAAAKDYWSKLTPAEKLEVLRFDDAQLVARLYDAQQSLFFADFECCMRGIRNREEVRHKAGLHFFDVEGVVEDDGSLRPFVFFTKPELAERTDLFEFLEQRLCHAFMNGTSNLLRHDWPTTFDNQPNSWSEFVRRVLQLVELAVFESWQLNTKGLTNSSELCDAQREESAAAAAAEELMSSEKQAKGTSRSSKRASRKKQAATSAVTSAAQSSSSAGPQARSASVGEACIDAEVSAVDFDCEDYSDFVEVGAADPGTAELNLATSPTQSERSFAAWSVRSDPDTVLATTQALRLTASVARIGAEVQPSLIASQASLACAREARMQSLFSTSSSFSKPEPKECSSWPAWQLLDGSSGEQWLDGYRTIVKNTFVDVIQTPQNTRPGTRRAQSLPLL